MNVELKNAEYKLYVEIEENFAEVSRAVQHKRGGFYLINKMKNFVGEMIESGQIEEKEGKYFYHRLDYQYRNLELNKIKIDLEDASSDFLSNCMLAKIFTVEELGTITSKFNEVNFEAGDVIIKKGAIIKDLYYVSRGIVHEKNGEVDNNEAPKVKSKGGDILGLQFITKDEGESFTN